MSARKLHKYAMHACLKSKQDCSILAVSHSPFKNVQAAAQGKSFIYFFDVCASTSLPKKKFLKKIRCYHHKVFSYYVRVYNVNKSIIGDYYFDDAYNACQFCLLWENILLHCIHLLLWRILPELEHQDKLERESLRL